MPPKTGRITMRLSALQATLGLCFLLAGPANAQTAQWVAESPLPFDRSEAAAAAVGGRVYVISGNSRGNQANSLVHELEPQNGQWTERALMPNVASHAGAATLGGKIYVVGGFVANVHLGAHARVFEYDPAMDSWRAVAPLPTPRGSPVVVALNGRLHAIGGRNAAQMTLDAHEVYDPATNMWTSAAPLPLARDHAGGAVVNGRIHVFGGRTAGQGDNVARHDVYDPRSNSWSEAAPLPTPRSAGAAAFVGGRIVYAGGECKDPAMATTFDEVEVYNPMTNAWTKLPAMPSGRHASAAVAVGAVMYIIGGNNGCGGQRPLREVQTVRLR
jgi:N-acetylneuraminic acid mutarotase